MKSNTLHNEVERIFGIKNIIFKRGHLSFVYTEKNNVENNTFDVFNKNIKTLINLTNGGRHGIFLSGGNESRINAAVSNHYNLSRKFVTWGHPKNKEYIIASNIAKKSRVEHFNIRPNVSELPYKDFLKKTGFLSNMQYAHRYQNVKMAFEQLEIDHLWTGWGDTTGYISINQSTEFFNSIFWSYTKDQKLCSPLWNKDFLSSYMINNFDIHKQKNKNLFLKNVFNFYHNTIAPRVYGQVLSAENLLGSIIAPWFNHTLYKSIISEETKTPSLYLYKKNRVIWKNNLYTKIIAQYDPKLNYLKNAKNYYPFLFNDYLQYLGLPLAYLLTKTANTTNSYFDPVEDKDFIKNELIKLVDLDLDYFNMDEIRNEIQKSDHWNGPIIMELFKVIQIYWLLKR